MARDEAIEARLLRWAEWVTVGDGSGYASVSPLHESWTPPAAGQRPMLKVARSHTEALATHQALRRLPLKLQATAMVHYVKRGTLAEQAAQLDCLPDTVLDRVERLHRALAGELCNIQLDGTVQAT